MAQRLGISFSDRDERPVISRLTRELAAYQLHRADVLRSDQQLEKPGVFQSLLQAIGLKSEPLRVVRFEDQEPYPQLYADDDRIKLERARPNARSSAVTDSLYQKWDDALGSSVPTAADINPPPSSTPTAPKNLAPVAAMAGHPATPKSSGAQDGVNAASETIGALWAEFVRTKVDVQKVWKPSRRPELQGTLSVLTWLGFDGDVHAFDARAAARLSAAYMGLPENYRQLRQKLSTKRRCKPIDVPFADVKAEAARVAANSNITKVVPNTGCGARLGSTVNRLQGNPVAAGVERASIDAILCTHIHPDHTNGLIDGHGHALYPNAPVYVHHADAAFWLSDEHRTKAPDDLKIQFDWAKEAFAPYEDRLHLIAAGEVLSGVELIELPGHTPGHSGYVVHSDNDALLIWGDAVHSISIQVARPDVSFAGDVDGTAARETRLRLFDQVATDRLLITGMHLEFPGFGYLTRDANRFRYEPEALSPIV